MDCYNNARCDAKKSTYNWLGYNDVKSELLRNIFGLKESMFSRSNHLQLLELLYLIAQWSDRQAHSTQAELINYLYSNRPWRQKGLCFLLLNYYLHWDNFRIINGIILDFHWHEMWIVLTDLFLENCMGISLYCKNNVVNIQSCYKMCLDKNVREKASDQLGSILERVFQF